MSQAKISKSSAREYFLYLNSTLNRSAPSITPSTALLFRKTQVHSQALHGRQYNIFHPKNVLFFQYVFESSFIVDSDLELGLKFHSHFPFSTTPLKNNTNTKHVITPGTLPIYCIMFTAVTSTYILHPASCLLLSLQYKSLNL